MEGSKKSDLLTYFVPPIIFLICEVVYVSVANPDLLAMAFKYYSSIESFTEKAAVPVILTAAMYAVGVFLQTPGHMAMFSVSALFARIFKLERYFYSDVKHGWDENLSLADKAAKSMMNGRKTFPF